jgi:hypothetical protein
MDQINQQQQQFTQDHHQIYNYLRQALMQLHMQGVPGISDILGALNQAHHQYGGPTQQQLNTQQQVLPRNLAQQSRQIGQQPIQTALPKSLPNDFAQQVQSLQGKPIVATPQAYLNKQKGVVR